MCVAKRAALSCIFLLCNGCLAPSRTVAPATETLSIGTCSPTPCVKVTINTLPELPSTISQEQKRSITTRVEEILYAPFEPTREEVSRQTFLAGVQALVDEQIEVGGPESVENWGVQRSASLLYADPNLISVSVSSEEYLGGAHAFNHQKLLVFDGVTGNPLSWEDMVGDESRAVLLKIAEAEFRRTRELQPSQSLSDAGFTFDGEGVFRLPESFALTPKGLNLYYNFYEAGPYVLGPTDLYIPLDVVSALLRKDKVDIEGLLSVKVPL